MEEDNDTTWGKDAEVLADIGRHLFGQRTRVEVRLPRALAEQALAAWQRDSDDSDDSDERSPRSETAQQHSVRSKAGTLALIGLSIENESTTIGDEVTLELDAWHIGDAFNAADEAGLLAGAKPPA